MCSTTAVCTVIPVLKLLESKITHVGTDFAKLAEESRNIDRLCVEILDHMNDLLTILWVCHLHNRKIIADSAVDSSGGSNLV